MNFDLYEEYRTKFWNLNMKVSMFVAVFALITLVIMNYINEEISQYVGLTMFVLFILSQFVELKSFFSKYESVKGKKGQLAINEIGIVWNGKNIDWKSIVDINIEYNEIDNKHNWDLSPQNNVSDGLNQIKFITNSGFTLEGYFKITNDDQMQLLKELLHKCILKNQLSYDLSKKIVQPRSYEEHQLLKKEINENTDNK